jgi:transposase-like protein
VAATVDERLFDPPGPGRLDAQAFDGPGSLLGVELVRIHTRRPGDGDPLDRRCRAYLEQLRWPDGVRCPRCGSPETGRLDARRKFYCRPCKYHFSVTAGTVFHNSHLPLWKWFLTVSVMLRSGSGVPANQLAGLLGGSYKTAWFAQQRVRMAIRQSAHLHDCCWDDEAERARCVRRAVTDRLVEPSGGESRLFDRHLVGAYHQLSVKYARAYAAEMEWRAQCRQNPHAFRDTILCLLDCDPLAFTELTGRGEQSSAVAEGSSYARNERALSRSMERNSVSRELARSLQA